MIHHTLCVKEKLKTGAEQSAAVQQLLYIIHDECPQVGERLVTVCVCVW